MKVNILSITPKVLKEGKLKLFLPEFYHLKFFSENNPGHLNQNVFDHVLAVFQNLEDLLDGKGFKQEQQKQIKKLFSQKVGRFSRKEILLVATLLHDIAKPPTFTVNTKTHQTSCPGHEIIGSVMAEKIAKRFRFDERAVDHMHRIIRFHGFVHEILGLSARLGKTNQYLDFLKKIAGDAYLELLLLAYADMLGSDLYQIDPSDFETRQKLITTQITHVLS